MSYSCVRCISLIMSQIPQRTLCPEIISPYSSLSSHRSHIIQSLNQFKICWWPPDPFGVHPPGSPCFGTLWAGISEAITRAYQSGQRHYLSFCSTFNLPPLPVQESVLCRFVAFVSFSLTYTFIRLYLSGVRQRRDHTKPRRLSITPDILVILYRSLSTAPITYQKAMLWAACCLAFFRFLRCGEFTCTAGSTKRPLVVALQDITIDSHDNPTIMYVHLRHSKTDQLGRGVTIALVQTRAFLCPVASH